MIVQIYPPYRLERRHMGPTDQPGFWKRKMAIDSKGRVAK